MAEQPRYVVGLGELSRDDVARVGGKNASLGEMLRELTAAGINVPPGFAITAEAYRAFLEVNELDDEVAARLDELRDGRAGLHEVGGAIRASLEAGELPEQLRDEIADAYGELAAEAGGEEPDVAVRSSATGGPARRELRRSAGDLPERARDPGGPRRLPALLRVAVHRPRDQLPEEQGFDHLQVSLSVGVQQMVRSDLACAGVMFSIDTETGFPATVVIDAAPGLGELVVAGSVDPDEHLVFKPLLDRPSLTPIIARKLGRKEDKMVYGAGPEPTRVAQTGDEERGAYALSDAEVLQLARWAVALEQHS